MEGSIVRSTFFRFQRNSRKQKEIAMSNTESKTAEPAQQQQASRPSGALPNFQHMSSHSPAAIEAYLHLYVDDLAKAEFGLTGNRR
jgi:hypothetical protein